MDAVDRALLERVARQAMVDYGLLPDFPASAKAQAEALPRRDVEPGSDMPDLRHLPWTSIDNPESQDLDQIEAVEDGPDGVRLYVAIADVAGSVQPRSPIDLYAAANTTSVYTGVHVFTMLPTRLSYGLTSLLPSRAHSAMVVDMRITAAGRLNAVSVYRAVVENRAKLNYPAVTRWLDGGPAPAELASAPMLQDQLRRQDALAQSLRKIRMAAGALDLDPGELQPVIGPAGEVVGLEARVQDRARSIIEELMIVANRAVVGHLTKAGLPCLLRVVRRPAHWEHIVEYALGRGVALPSEPDSIALARFLDRMRQRRPHEFQEISLSIVKLIGRGEYAAHRPGGPPIGHFGLATREYGHATAPNRRYPDLVMQRLLAGDKSSVDFEYLDETARRCTAMEAQAEKVARRVHKSIAAALLAHRIGEVFDGVITKAHLGGTFVHVFHPAVQGMVLGDTGRVKVGDRVRVRLASVDVERSLIDFVLEVTPSSRETESHRSRGARPEAASE
jgi:VacB/RNase II family 3'-5' exoribonuclease